MGKKLDEAINKVTDKAKISAEAEQIKLEESRNRRNEYNRAVADFSEGTKKITGFALAIFERTAARWRSSSTNVRTEIEKSGGRFVDEETKEQLNQLAAMKFFIGVQRHDVIIAATVLAEYSNPPEKFPGKCYVYYSHIKRLPNSFDPATTNESALDDMIGEAIASSIS